MDLTITLPDQLAGELRRGAERRGIEPQRYAAQLISEHLPAADRAKSLQSLFAVWAAEDATDDPAEIANRQAEWDELKRAINANRTSGRKPFAE
jgi:hypothetical protein